MRPSSLLKKRWSARIVNQPPRRRRPNEIVSFITSRVGTSEKVELWTLQKRQDIGPITWRSRVGSTVTVAEPLFGQCRVRRRDSGRRFTNVGKNNRVGTRGCGSVVGIQYHVHDSQIRVGGNDWSEVVTNTQKWISRCGGISLITSLRTNK
jgi:hypothetical protein